MGFQKTHSFQNKSSHTPQPMTQFGVRPFEAPVQLRPLGQSTPEEMENEAFERDEFEAHLLETKEKYGTITPEEQELLGGAESGDGGFLGAQKGTDKRFGHNFANIPVNPPGEQDAPQLQPMWRDGTPGVPMGGKRSLFNFEQQSSASPLQAKLTIGQPGDEYEQEADRVASQVVEQIHAPTTAQSNQGQSVQRQEENQEEVQAKPEITALQRQEEKPEELQTKPILQSREVSAGGEASTDLESAINNAKGSGKPIEASLQKSMGQAMGADFSQVRVHTDAQSDQLNQSIQAKAFTTGQDVFFRQGAYEPGSRGGQELIAHELTHVVQQSRGTISSEEKGDKKIINRVENIGHERISLKNGKGSNIPEKAKGEDYANNVQKLLEDLNGLLVGFSNEAIRQALRTINENRPKCTVSTSQVEGEDTNTAAYGSLKDNIVAAVSQRQYLLEETDSRHFRKEVRVLVDTVIPLIRSLPQAAVDPRVAEVIASDGKNDQKTAKLDIDAALRKLSEEVEKRLKEYLQGLWETKFSPKKDNEPKDPPSGGGTGGMIPVN
ncbi:DUF4157 domain-containing protein [Microcoleus sp. AS-A8]